jgi:hypothetical protein
MDGMLEFPKKVRIDKEEAGALAEAIHDDYPHESLADVSVFMYRAANNNYGTMDDRGRITKKGKIYGTLTKQTLLEWFQQYLMEKAELLERQHHQLKHSKPEPVEDPAEQKRRSDGLRKVLAQFEEDKKYKLKLQSLERRTTLEKHCSKMSDVELRHAYKLYIDEPARLVILREANKRGLVEQHLIEQMEKLVNDGTPL